MADRRNYLLGRGEKLTDNAVLKMGFDEGRAPYSFPEARAALAPLATATTRSLDALPDSACPRDESVAVLTLHPKYVSKSAYPTDFLNAVGLRSVGSKGVTVTPRKSHLDSKPAPSASVELFVAGSRKAFRAFSENIKTWSINSAGADDLIKVEKFRAATAQERVKPIHSKQAELLFEIVLHAGGQKRAKYILDAFEAYLRSLDIKVNLDDRIDAEELSFIPVRAPRAEIATVAEFSFLRLAREMPRMRELWPAASQDQTAGGAFPFSAPTGGALDPTIRVAVFDGGNPDIPSLRKYVKGFDGDGVVGSVKQFEQHGLSVTSALLFGPLEKGAVVDRPFANVDHYRVLDQQTADKPEASVYPILKRIIKVLEAEKYDFVNFSIGPAIPVDDDDVHPWTAKLDPLLAGGHILASVAVGNNGEREASMGLNRIQPPADCVNALSVGASDGNHPTWRRASYSSVGHGRCPGVMKPDGVVPGGTIADPFWVVDASNTSRTRGVRGTSFSSPSALRAAIGVRAHLGPVLRGLALKALLIHNSDLNGHDKAEVGWGQFCTDVETLVTCAKGKAHVIYQGILDPKKNLRAIIPMPKKLIEGLVTIKATICHATQTDPEHPLTYTRSGLQIFFRKDLFNVPAGKVNPKSSGFFKTGLGKPEQVIREDAHQWETVRHETKRMRGKSLTNPCFDIHYNPRSDGHDTKGEGLPYAMIITIDAPGVDDLFDQVFARYKFRLAELKPQIELPIRLK